MWLGKSWLCKAEIEFLTHIYQSFTVVVCGVMKAVLANNHWVSGMAILSNFGIKITKDQMYVVSLDLVQMICKGGIEVLFGRG